MAEELEAEELEAEELEAEGSIDGLAGGLPGQDRRWGPGWQGPGWIDSPLLWQAVRVTRPAWGFCALAKDPASPQEH